MQHWSVQDILDATQGRLLGQSNTVECTGVSIDTRTLRSGEAYLAIKGLKFDGHAFLEQAVERGARCLIVSDSHIAAAFQERIPVVLVEDTTIALGDLARFHRQRLNKTVVAITGSCGKTTTKDLIASILGGEGPVVKTSSNQNNHIGVPLTLLRVQSHHRYVVVEMGSNHPGEIAYLASVTEPDVAVITNVGPAHLEHFGSMIQVLEEKLSLLRYLCTDGTAILPADQLDVCLEAGNYLSAGCKRVCFGSQERADIRMQHVTQTETGMSLQLDDALGSWKIPLVGYHNAENALAAIACCQVLGIPSERIKERLAHCNASPLRSELVKIDGVQFLNDCYNANPLSCARALEVLRDMNVERRVAVLGDMLELGDFAPSAHLAIGRLAAGMGIDEIIAVGEFAHFVAEGANESGTSTVHVCTAADEALTLLQEKLQSGDGVLIKGSRRIRLESIAAAFKVQQSRHSISPVLAI